MRKPYSTRSRPAPDNRASPAQQSVERHIDRAGVISAAGAVISGLFAIPGGIYAASQLSQIRTASVDAAASLRTAQDLAATAKRELAELQSQTRSASESARHTAALASHTDDIARSTRAEAGGIRDLVGQAAIQAAAAREAARETARLGGVQGEQVQITKRELVPVLYPADYGLDVLAPGQVARWTYTLVSRNGRVPDQITIWARTSVEPSARFTPPIPGCGAPGSETLYFKRGTFASAGSKPLSPDDVRRIQAGQAMLAVYGLACFKLDGRWAGATYICAASSKGQIFDCRPNVG